MIIHVTMELTLWALSLMGSKLFLYLLKPPRLVNSSYFWEIPPGDGAFNLWIYCDC